MNVHPITGVTTLKLHGETRTLACDMNCAAALFDIVGEQWSEWLVSRFLGEQVDGGRKVQALSPVDTVTALYALLATDREDSRRDETLASLRRSVSIVDIADIHLALVRCVLSSFGVPGEFIEAVVNAVDAPR